MYDIAFSINLNEAERRITSLKQRETIRHKRKAPRYFEYHPAPLRISQDPETEVVIYDFGAVSVIYRMPLSGDLPKLLELSQELYENERLLSDSRRRVEGVNNVLKLLGDQYLARLYRLVAQRFHLADWDSSILRKLETLESIYQKMSDQVASRRMEMLEWIIIVLITISILLPFVSGLASH